LLRPRFDLAECWLAVVTIYDRPRLKLMLDNAWFDPATGLRHCIPGGGQS
jgi:hypothetical protein